MKEYKTLKLNKEEIEFLKGILIEKYVNRLTEKEKGNKDLIIQGDIKLSGRLLNVIEYIER